MTQTISLEASAEAGKAVGSPTEVLDMARFKGVVKECVRCGAEFRVPLCRAASAKACSHECAVSVRAKSIERKVVVQCQHCGEDFSVPRCHAGRRVYCSKPCMEASPDVRARKGDRVGIRNPSWGGGRVQHADGYIYDSAHGHPFTSNGYVLEHRLLMEKHLVETDPGSPYLIEIDGALYLSPKFVVHHRDENKANNTISNLQCMTPKEHRDHHNAIIRAALAFYRKHFPAT